MALCFSHPRQKGRRIDDPIKVLASSTLLRYVGGIIQPAPQSLCHQTTKPVAVAAPQLRFGAEANQVNKPTNSAKGFTIKNLLVQCYNAKLLKQSDWRRSSKVDLPLTIDSKNHSVARYALELCHFVMDDNERQAFQLQS